MLKNILKLIIAAPVVYVGLILLLFGVPLFLGPIFHNMYFEKEFKSTEWKTIDKLERYKYIESLKESGKLFGLSRAEVTELLGEDFDSTQIGVWKYHVGNKPNGFLPDMLFLEVRFDENKVTGVKY